MYRSHFGSSHTAVPENCYRVCAQPWHLRCTSNWRTRSFSFGRGSLKLMSRRRIQTCQSSLCSGRQKPMAKISRCSSSIASLAWTWASWRAPKSVKSNGGAGWLRNIITVLIARGSLARQGNQGILVRAVSGSGKATVAHAASPKRKQLCWTTMPSKWGTRATRRAATATTWSM